MPTTQERLGVRVDAQTKRRLQLEASAKGISPSDVVREAIEQYLQAREGEETMLDRLNRLGIVGYAKDLPTDYSTNPKYMKGFGSRRDSR